MTPRSQPGLKSAAVTRQAPPLPLWVNLLDAVALVYAVLALSVVCVGGVDVSFLGVHVTATALPRVLLYCVGSLVVRHAVWRRHPLHRRLLTWVSRWRGSESARAVWPVFAVSRIGVLTVGFLGVLLVGLSSDPPFRVSRNELSNLSARWDAGWYLGIAEDGYEAASGPETQQNIAFFPAYPVLTRAVGALLGAGVVQRTVDPFPEASRRYVLAGLLVALGAFFAALVYLYRLARDCFDTRVARASVLLLAAYPFAIFFSAPYTESLFLLSAVATFYHFRRAEHGRAALWGLLAGLTKANGCLLSVPLAILALQQAGLLWRGASTRLVPVPTRTPAAHAGAMAAASMPGIGMVLFSAYLFLLTGRPLAWLDVHRLAWERSYVGLGDWALGRYGFVMDHDLYSYAVAEPIELLYVVAVGLVLSLVWPVSRRLGLPYGVWMVLTVVPPLMAGGFVSMGRFTSVLFPLFLYAAATLPRRWVVPAALVSAQLQALMAVLFYTWRPLY